MIYRALTDICSQHIDTHHHFFVTTSNTYIYLPRLLNFTNHLDESNTLWIGKFFFFEKQGSQIDWSIAFSLAVCTLICWSCSKFLKFGFTKFAVAISF